LRATPRWPNNQQRLASLHRNSTAGKNAGLGDPFSVPRQPSRAAGIVRRGVRKRGLPTESFLNEEEWFDWITVRVLDFPTIA
jgi:hypothetical protein